MKGVDISLSRDSAFLRKLDLENLKTYYVKIIVLGANVEYNIIKDSYLKAVKAYGENSAEAKAAATAAAALNSEMPLKEIQGRVSSGSLTIDGSSSVRRAGNITFVAEEAENDLTDIDNLLSMNKKIRILVGLENNIDKENYDDIIWFNQGVFVITQPSLSHGTNGVTISLQIKDKMCLLNGDCGGGLPASVQFDEYDQIIGFQDNLTAFPQQPNNYTVYKVDNKCYMWTAESGWDECSEELVGTTVSVKQRIYDIIQTLVCNYGGEDLSKIIINDVDLEIRNKVRYVGSDSLYYNSSTGQYSTNVEDTTGTDGEWTTFSYNDDCGYIYTDFTYPGTDLTSSIGENVCSVLEKIKTALGNYEYFYDLDGNFVFQEIKNYLNTTYEPVVSVDRKYTLSGDGLILDAETYKMDLSNTSRSIYTFEEGSTLLTAYSNSPSYTNIKNDFQIWGKNEDGNVIHYHIAIKEKPSAPYSTWSVVAETDDNGDYTGKIHVATGGEKGYSYTPTDWRAELYLQGSQKKALQQRPDIYEQELLDLFDSIYDMRAQEYKADIVNCPNDLKYWIDYIKPSELFDISIDAIGSRIYSYQQEKIKRLYDAEVPNVVMIDKNSSPISQSSLIEKCENCGQTYSRVNEKVYNSIALGTTGYSAQEVARDLLYQYTDYSSAISITSIPIYYLDANNRITVSDKASGIYGDYVIKSISLPLDPKGTMNITASKALERV